MDKSGYQKMLGKLMWFSRKVKPECANPVRELAMFMDNPGEEHWKAMARLVGYVQSEEPILILRKPQDLNVIALVDSNFATNKETRRSVAGYLVTVGGCFISHMSKIIPAITLSSTESEYVAASMCATEIKFIQMLFEELVPTEVTRPGILLEDNTGAIHLIENKAVGNHTKYIDIRMHHIREMIEGTADDGARMKVVFVRTDDNVADVLTKNVTEKIHNYLVPIIKNGTFAIIYDKANREDVKMGDVQT